MGEVNIFAIGVIVTFLFAIGVFYTISEFKEMYSGKEQGVRRDSNFKIKSKKQKK
ncbi:hypothetical protein [Fodinibius sp.]|uniref:hypothetical protein n=1 Tax=Fodinibius sp. TaxID=1872440 RepID=UPI002ACDC881|nr:hypothetical protein [Fodinibius sp.]MDZ7660147.1 hypothetical protein [Fodinibius sp.]